MIKNSLSIFSLVLFLSILLTPPQSFSMDEVNTNSELPLQEAGHHYFQKVMIPAFSCISSLQNTIEIDHGKIQNIFEEFAKSKEYENLKNNTRHKENIIFVFQATKELSFQMQFTPSEILDRIALDVQTICSLFDSFHEEFIKSLENYSTQPQEFLTSLSQLDGPVSIPESTISLTNFSYKKSGCTDEKTCRLCQTKKVLQELFPPIDVESLLKQTLQTLTNWNSQKDDI